MKLTHKGVMKSTDMKEPIYWLTGSTSCVYEYWEMADGIWKTGYDIYRLLHSNRCDVVMDRYGAYYYKYYANPGQCASTIEQKTIAGAIQAALRALDGQWLCNIYAFEVDHAGSWHGTIIVGPNMAAWSTAINKANYKGYMSEGCSGLQAPYTCSSKENGA